MVGSIEKFRKFFWEKFFSEKFFRKILFGKNSFWSTNIDRLLPFDFIIEHIPCTRMCLVYYISRQPNQKAKSISQNDEEFMVATISRIRDAVTTLFSNSSNIPFQKHQNNSKRK